MMPYFSGIKNLHLLSFHDLNKISQMEQKFGANDADTFQTWKAMGVNKDKRLMNRIPKYKHAKAAIRDVVNAGEADTKLANYEEFAMGPGSIPQLVVHNYKRINKNAKKDIRLNQDILQGKGYLSNGEKDPDRKGGKVDFSSGEFAVGQAYPIPIDLEAIANMKVGEVRDVDLKGHELAEKFYDKVPKWKRDEVRAKEKDQIRKISENDKEIRIASANINEGYHYVYPKGLNMKVRKKEFLESKEYGDFKMKEPEISNMSDEPNPFPAVHQKDENRIAHLAKDLPTDPTGRFSQTMHSVDENFVPNPFNPAFKHINGNKHNQQDSSFTGATYITNPPDEMNKTGMENHYTMEDALLPDGGNPAVLSTPGYGKEYGPEWQPH
jgi:hypothetical protein